MRNLRNVVAAVIATLAVAIPGTVFIPNAVTSDNLSPREFVALFIEDWNALNHGEICDKVAVETRGGPVENCAYYSTINDGQLLYFAPLLRPKFALRPEKHAKVLEFPHNVYSVPIIDTWNNSAGYADVQRDKDGEWKVRRLRTEN